jgi:hypothetical protein
MGEEISCNSLICRCGVVSDRWRIEMADNMEEQISPDAEV